MVELLRSMVESELLRSVVVLVVGLVLGRWLKRAEDKYKERKYLSKFAPIEVEDNGQTRYFTWRGRDPVHLIAHESPPRQLLGFYRSLCHELRKQSGMEPQFDLPHNIRGEIVYEISADRRSKWQLMGGNDTAPGNQVLVLAPK